MRKVGLFLLKSPEFVSVDICVPPAVSKFLLPPDESDKVVFHLLFHLILQ